MTPPSPDDLKRHLAVRIRSLAQAIIPDGKLDGSEWVGTGPDGAKWGVVVKGIKAGCYQNFGSGAGGFSGLGLIRDAVTDGDPRRAYAWALKFLGDAVLLPQRMTSVPAKPVRLSRPDAEPEAQSGDVTGLRLYLAAQPFTWDTPPGCYLQARGITPERVTAPLRALRFHPTCWQSDVQRHMPAMLAAVIDPDPAVSGGRHLAVHRTYLALDPAGVWRKAPVGRPKKVIGRYAGGVIPLTRGASGLPLMRAPEGDAALIAEGIENALTASIWFPELRALAAVAVANLAHITLPPAIADIMLIRDRDGENEAVMESRDRAIVRWTAEGRAVSLWEPPEGSKDANDYWQDVQAGRVEA